MDFQHLRAFIAVADDLHVGRAAQRLHITQPTLSRQIAALERDLGVVLFDRSRRRLGMTTAGELLLPEARELVARAERARRTAQRAAMGEIGRLRLGFVQSAIYEALPRLVQRFRAEHPDVDVEATPMTTLQQLRAFDRDALDAGLLRPQQPATTEPASGLETHVISRDPMVVALPADHTLASQDAVVLADLADERFLLYPHEAGSTGYDLIIDTCARAGFTPEVVQHAGDAATIVALVAAGSGISIMIGPPPPIDPTLVTYRVLHDDLPTWDLALAWSPDNPSTTLAHFVAVATGG